MKRRFDIKGKRALVTGGGSGIGLATAERLAGKGAVPILVDINSEALDGAMSRLKGEGFEAYAFRLDVTDIDKVRGLADELRALEMSPDILVNCAGTTLVAHVTATDHDEWKRIIDVNLMGTIHMVETFLPHMVERGCGHIVNIGSIDGFIPIPGQAPYCASKFAITGLTEVLYYDLKNRGVGVTMICPGYINTPMAKSLPIKDFPLHFKGFGTVVRFLELFSGNPRKVASHTVDAILHNKFLVIPGLPSKVFYHYRRLFPRLATASGLVVSRFFEWLRRRVPRRAFQTC
ncbi:MAG: SDR family NAD(P)-dependent oxidoreductase [Actinomycetota bacterium]|nr:SDR family NAD(P)-dependent oxidoreductase [Actinomycetota bacterium]